MLFIPLLKERSPFPAPPWGSSHGRLFSMNFFDATPSHRQLFRPSLLQYGPPLHRVPSFKEQAAAGWVPLSVGLTMGSYPSPRHLPTPVKGSFMSCRWISASLWIPMGCRGTASPGAAPQAAGESYLSHLDHLLPLFLQ